MKRIDPEKTLIGQEHTAQDQAMVDEQGRSSKPTAHRWEKLRAFVEVFKEKMKVTKKKSVRERNDFTDPGFYIDTKKFGEYRVNMEPVTIEVNAPPPNIFQLRARATPIYDTFAEIGLIPYVRPAGERSGMGHAHLGGATLKDSPFYIFPNLLPNLMVYLHNNPAALFGLSEAYDMGRDSNMETYHYGPRQVEFAAVIEEFHEWWKSHPKKRAEVGLAKFVSLISKTSFEPTEHYRYINIERFKGLGTSKADLKSQKERTAITVEVRVIRPYKTVDHAEAVGMYLLKLLDYLSDPKLLLKLNRVDRESFQYYYSGTEIALNWEKVKRDIGFSHPLVNEMVQEYVDNVRLRTVPAEGLPHGAVVSAAYSRKEEKGLRYELRIPVQKKNANLAPAVALNGLQIPLKKIAFEGKDFWVGLFHLLDYKISLQEFQEGKSQFVFGAEAAKFPLREIKGNRPQKIKAVVESERANESPLVERELIPVARVIEILLDKESTIEAARAAFVDFIKYSKLVNAEWVEAPISDNFARSLLRVDDIFIQMKGYLHFLKQPDFKPSDEDLTKIVKALDNSRFSDQQSFYSRLAARMLYKFRADSNNNKISSELYSTIRFDTDAITKTYALVAYLANGGPRDHQILTEVQSTLQYLRTHRGQSFIADSTALLDYLLQVTEDRAPTSISKGPMFACRAVIGL